jgi:hypothetical protein
MAIFQQPVNIEMGWGEVMQKQKSPSFLMGP